MSNKSRLIILTVVGAAVATMAHTLLAFVFLFEDGTRWPPGVINMEMQLGDAAGGLIDGSSDWDECAIAKLAELNAVLGPTGVSFNAVRGSTVPPVKFDGFNNVFFADDFFDTPFGDSTLAITSTQFVTFSDGSTEIRGADVGFNNAKPLNCYGGPRQLGNSPEGSNTNDLGRVALHEFLYGLGMDHPDEAIPPQTVVSIMNAFISDLDVMQTDDIQGLLTLYGIAVVGIPFPPRDQVLDFFLDLESEYRDTLGRQQNNPGNVNAEGSAVWFPEFLRYVLNGCSTVQATNRVLAQISGQGIQPVCGVVPPGVINFPPRNESLDFLIALDTFYRDTLNENAPDSYIDLEGKAVWLQEYLRYRVNGCTNQESTDRVFQQIRGGGIAPICV